MRVWGSALRREKTEGGLMVRQGRLPILKSGDGTRRAGRDYGFGLGWGRAWDGG